MQDSRQSNRRTFLVTAGALTAVALAPKSLFGQNSAAESLTVAVMGCNGRGTSLATAFAGQPNVRVKTICDADERVLAKRQPEVAKVAPDVQTTFDYRRVLDDKDIDVLVIAAPDHWHVPATILGCQAGKHVYVEKPLAHNVREAEWVEQAARKYDRVVQVGTQRRSFPGIQEGMQRLLEGEFGKIRYSRGWYNNRRGSIGHGKAAPVPAGFHYDLWQGPADATDYRDNYAHYNWHWFWRWGTGELGNNGIHALDLCRWGLGVETPTEVTSAGEKLRWNDDQETPDTHLVTWKFDDGKMMHWECLSWSALGFEHSQFGASFHGEGPTMVVDGSGYTLFDEKNQQIEKKGSGGGDSAHVADFLAAVRENRRPNADVSIGRRSTELCLWGNVAHRAGRAVKPADDRDSADLQPFLGREYAEGWEKKLADAVS